MNDDREPLPAWFVAFHPPKVRSIWTRFLKSGFGHCFAFAPDNGRWIIVDQAFDCAYVRTIDEAHVKRMWKHLHEIGATVLLADMRFNPVRAPRLGATCATSVAVLLGERGLCALTPFGLYRILRRRGALTIMEPSNGIDIQLSQNPNAG